MQSHSATRLGPYSSRTRIVFAMTGQIARDGPAAIYVRLRVGGCAAFCEHRLDRCHEAVELHGLGDVAVESRIGCGTAIAVARIRRERQRRDILATRVIAQLSDERVAVLAGHRDVT